MFPLPNFTNPSRTQTLRVWVSNPSLAADLVRFLSMTVYEPGPVSGDTVAIRPPSGLDDRIARVELEVYLRLWRRCHPSETAEIMS